MTVMANTRKRTQRRDIFPLINGVILCVLMLVTLYPVLNTVAISFNDGTDAVRGGIGLWPRVFSTKSYQYPFFKTSFYRALNNGK